MSDEIELKLAVSPQAADILIQEIARYPILAQKKTFLANCYYDSADCYFAHQKMGLRVRRENDRFTMTLKTNGNVLGGLHIRPEYNVELESDAPDLSKLSIFNETLPKLPADLQVQPVFNTDFERHIWLLEGENREQIEVALDRGEIKSGEKTEIISELEFELKQGNVADLLSFVAGLNLTDGVRLSALSKAKRGYQLAYNQAREPVDWLDKWRDILKSEENHGNLTAQLKALFHHEQQLVEETMALKADYFARNFLTSVERIGAFFNLYHHYIEQPNLLGRIVNEKLAQGKNVDDSVISELTESNNYLFNQIRDLIRLHSETKDNLLALTKLIALLHEAGYVRRMLNLIRLTME
ncbi:CYTH domain-containing protein [Basfia succiniciproducens]|uniref:Inorganic triphosphatase YgiF, contains CYTH and CHAD domains n=1 Tax=Basfia succiniciproducens TaxID=653940 RepID=A0A1G5DL24_9PAST|nr:CYTH domain-containing protein [Basfia succiniciproducens]QIM69482.1 adenylate cyclase [Basfia succiniciproducens]SCY15120.1 Inorganic triphosphatase YgiF, contains CYTH and CHAD domains [Basfia succiniciproducens]